MTLGEGQQFAGYILVRVLGSGGMGQVYLAQHPRLPRQEALKILRPEISTDESFRERFIREADSVAALDHPHIVTVFDRGDSNGQLWIATQYIDGADAGQLLRERYPAGMPVDEVVAITTAIAEALDYAHGRGILYRDVKPANILLATPDDEGQRRVYLADFGIARPMDDPAGLTATNFTVGTVAYAAPEQLMGNDIDGRADQYALAATAYHLLTGTPLYPESNPVAVISRHLAEPPPKLSAVRADLAPLDAAFARALAKQPVDRFPSCRDFARALAAAAGQSGMNCSASAPTQEARVVGNDRTKPVGRRRNPAAPAVVGAALAVLVAGVLVWWRPWAGTGVQEPTPSTPTASPTTAAPATTSSTSSAAPPPQATTTTTTNAPLPAVTSSPPPPTPNYPSAGALGEWCSDRDGKGSWADGTIVYCARLQGTDGYQWSLTPGTIPNPALNKPMDIPPGYPCMVPGSTINAVSGPLTCQLSASGWRWLP